MDDVVIVGGGPAGSVAAAQLAQRGVNAVLLDARQFPREKACGGGIQHRCLQFLPSDFSTVERAGCSSVRLSHGLVSTAVRDAGRPVVHCVTRWEFDHFLLEKAKSAGRSRPGRCPRHFCRACQRFRPAANEYWSSRGALRYRRRWCEQHRKSASESSLQLSVANGVVRRSRRPETRALGCALERNAG